MAARPFSYSPTQATITGTTNVGTLCVGVSALDYSSKPGGLTWWMGPDEDNSYVVCKDVSTQNFPTPVGNIGNVQFWRSANTDLAFKDMVATLSGISQVSATAASEWLSLNGYWTNRESSAFDTDAQAFITAAAITDLTQQTAIDTLVIGLKADSIWSKIGIIYPFVGGNATSHRYNLKSADSYLLTFYGDWTHSSTGAQPNGINAYASTGYLDSAYGVNIHRAVYSRQNIEGTGTDLAVSNSYIYGESGGGGANVFNIGITNFSTQLGDSYSFANHTTHPNTLGLFVSSRTGAGSLGLDISGYRNGTLLSTVNTNSGYGIGSNFTTGKPIYLSAQYYYVDEDGTPVESIGEYSNRQQSFVSYGEGLTSAEVANLYTRVQAFQTTLSRQV